MKLTFFLVIVFVVGANANGLAQKITLAIEKAKPEQLFFEIRKQTDYRFLYNEDVINKLETVTIDVRDASIGEVLNYVTKNKQLTYKIIGNTVSIRATAARSGNLPVLAVQEDINLSGTVKDSKGESLPGASIRAKNISGRATTANNEGKFNLRVPKGSILVVSYLGFKTQEVPVGASQNLTITLEEDGSELDEVVVVGYGTQTRKETTGSLSSVKGEALTALPVQSFDASLGGRATGVQITASGGVVNQAPVFKIRGTNSLSLSSYPLIVIDGVPTFTNDNESGPSYAANNPMSSINPADIETIDIAKDAAATSIYGSRAANGVVFITTKKGKSGRAKVTYDTWFGMTKANRLPSLLNAEQYVEIKNESLINDGTYNAETNYYSLSYDANGQPIDTRWYDYIYQTGFSQSHNLSVSGANESTNYYGSVGYTAQDGIFKENGFNRKSALFNVDNKTTSWLHVGAKINYINENNLSAMSTGAGGSSFQSSSSSGAMSRLALINAPIASPFNNDGSYNSTANGFLGLQDNAGHLNQSRLGFYNPLISLENNYSNNKVNQIQSNAYVQVMPLPWLSLRSVYGIDYRYMTFNNYFSPLSGEAISTNGSASSVNFNRERWVWTNTITANKSFGEHSFNLLLGQEQQKTKGEQFGLERQGQTDPYYTNIQGGWQNVFEYRTDNMVINNYLFSLFSRVQYDYKKRYFITANYRQDEYSALGINNKKGTFWGFSGGWDMSQESFWADAGLNDTFSNFKLRASYGKVGNVGGLNDFGALNTYSAILYGGQSGLVYTATGNPDLRWETSKKTDLGINFGLFQDRLTGEVAYYRNSIDGLIFGVPLPPSAGIPNTNNGAVTNNVIMQNVGEMYNQGIEVSLSGSPISGKAFTWNSSFNVTTNKNRVVSLANGVPSIITGSLDGMTITMPGYAAGMLYAVRTAGVDPATGRRIFLDGNGNKVYYQQAITGDNGVQYQWEYEDGTQAPAITPAADAIPYKTTAPKVFGGWDNTFRYKGFELNVLLTYQLGGYMMNGTQGTMRDLRFWNNSTDILRRWQNPGDITDIPRVVNSDNVSNGNTLPLDANISSTDYLRLKNVLLAYNLPASILAKLHVNSLRVYASGQNLALLTSYSGLDPEVSTNANVAIRQGIDKNQAPNARTITFGLNVGF
ncbi:TonB-dependent receptor [Olivibacter sp. XZL3]|uniref:TonB-dependent receptor n=1 Tax=Olivibacter sp. XZL3 TaxID=1735116 RepID=UPI001416EDCE|nr:TonB-dependent receptor [Olivibacter sp. XZL3]